MSEFTSHLSTVQPISADELRTLSEASDFERAEYDQWLADCARCEAAAFANVLLVTVKPGTFKAFNEMIESAQATLLRLIAISKQQQELDAEYAQKLDAVFARAI